MKATLATLILLISSGLLANDFLDLNEGKKPLCSSPLVRLSPKPIPCIPDVNDDGIFDIPELELDLSDLEDVFNGAESSGGHTIGPMNAPRRTGMPITPFPMSLKCEARLLSDGGKRVNFLSKQSFNVSARNFSTYLFTDKWVHGITQERSLYPENWVQVPVTPKVEFKNYSVMLGFNYQSRMPMLTVCEGNLKTAKQETVAACAEVEFSRYSYRAKTRLKTLTIKENIRIQKTLEINCRVK